MKKTMTSIMLCLLLLVTGIPAGAEAKTISVQTAGEITPYYTYLSSVGASISIESSGYASCVGNLILFTNYNTSITVTLQRSKDGSSWTDVKSWTEDFTGIGSHSLGDGYYVNSGYTYRVKNVSKVKSGSTVLETATVYSAEVSH